MRHKVLTDYEAFAPIFTRVEHQRVLDCIGGIRFKPIEFRYARVGPEWSTSGEPRTDIFHHIDFVDAGEYEVWDDTHRLRVEEGQIAWLPANSPFYTRCHRPLSVYFLRMRCEWLAGLDLFWNWRQPLGLGNWDRQRWREQWAQRPFSMAAHWQFAGLLQSAFSMQAPALADYIQQQMELHAEFATMFEFLDQNLSAELRVADLAEIQGVTLNGFTRIFRRHFGMAPKAYLNRRLNQEACDLLLSTDKAVRQIARQLRFHDEYYFYRFFLKMNRVSPRNYRLQMHGRHA